MPTKNKAANETAYFAIVFESSPSDPEDNPRFIEVENSKGESVKLGEWARKVHPKYPDRDLWELRIFVRKVNGQTILQIPASNEGEEWAEELNAPEEK